VTVVTSAAQDIPETAVRWAAAHFARLGAAVRGCFVQTRSDAEDPALLAQLGGASAIYLCGGDPGAAQAVLFQSAAAEALHTAYRGGIPLAGSSAGAMVLGGECLLPGENFGLRPGLGLVPDLVVVPHWNSAGRRWREVAIELGRESRVVAIDESTGVCWDGAGWQVRGQGRAVLVSGGGERAVEGGGLPPPVE
jgi:cyanophycinase